MPCAKRSSTSRIGASDADRRVRRQAADQERREAHDQQRGHEHRLAPDAVAEVTEDDAAQRARGEADGERAERRERADQRLGVREEQLVEDERGGCPVEEEVVPLDRGADEAGRDDLAQVRLSSTAAPRRDALTVMPCGSLLPVQPAGPCRATGHAFNSLKPAYRSRTHRHVIRTGTIWARLDDLDLSLKLSARGGGRCASTRRRSACSRCGSRSAARSATRRSGRRVLVIFEGWDASGKGGAIKRLVAGSTRATCASSSSRRRPTTRSATTGCWRFWPPLPGWGGMAVYDRSWYGRVLVERVEKFATKEQWSARLRRDQRLRAHAGVRGDDPRQVLHPPLRRGAAQALQGARAATR